MPVVTITVSPWPNVPNLPGVPQLARSPQFPTSSLPTLGSPAPASQLYTATAAGPTWGIFDMSGNLVVAADSVLAFSNKSEWTKPTYPIEGGKLSTFNKVIRPFSNYVRLSKGGSLTDRQDFIAQIDAIAGDLNNYMIVSPEKTYQPVNLSHHEETRRGAEGAYFLAEVDLYFEEVLDVEAQFSSTTANTTNAQNPAAVPSTAEGNVQPTPTANSDSLNFIRMLAGGSS